MPRLILGSDHLVSKGSKTELANVLSMLTTSEVKRRSRPYASTVAYCPTQNWLADHAGEIETVTPAPLKLYQGVGNGVEDVIVQGFEAHGKLLSTQVKLPLPTKSYKIDIGGYIDMIAFDRNGAVAAYEIKTSKNLPIEPKATHLSQAMTYACLGGFDKTYIVYVGREVQNLPDPTPLVRVFELDVAGLLESYMTTIVFTCHTLKQHYAPMRPAHFRKSNECSYCPFLQKCWNVDGFEFMEPDDNQAEYDAASKIALELIDKRPQFFLNSLSNAIGSAPEASKDKLKDLIKQESSALRTKTI